MNQWTRREVLRSGILASAAASINGLAKASTDSKKSAEVALAATESAPSTAIHSSPGRERLLLDTGWRFSLGNSSDTAKDFGYAQAARERPFAKSGKVSKVTSAKFDDTSWRIVDLPHDWAVELPFVSTTPMPEQGGRPLGREYPETSVGWYRKTFTLYTEDANKRIWLEFDGVMRSADIFINGHYLARHFSGYAPLRVDVTDWANYGGDSNLIVVRCDVTLGEGWFYEGAGIYRHVWLSKQPALRLADDGSFAHSRQHNDGTELLLQGEIANDTGRPRQAHLLWQLVDDEGTVAAEQTSPSVSVPAWTTATVNAATRIASPRPWSLDHPYCYTLRTRLIEAGKIIDTDTVTFGIRAVVFDSNRGFFLNGKPVKIKGTCNHQDHAGVGSALPDALNTWRLQQLKKMGSNACRTTHNCPAPEFLEAADRLGMMVMCETRMMDANEEGLSQLTAMIRRYRNHPSIILWSLGNEEPEQGTSRGIRIVSTMKRTAHRLDPSRLVTVAMNGEQGEGITNVVDVQGFNYSESKIDEVHAKFPTLPIIGTETASSLATRGIYKTDEKAGYVTAYDRNAPGWGKSAENWWKFYAARPFLAGGFAWTGFDYRGEPTPYSWPCVSSHFGVLDACGFPKDTYYYYKAWWGDEPVLHLFPHWNWEAGSRVEVWVHSNLDRVELMLNGRSLGVKTVERNTHLSWGDVPFEAGVLEALGWQGDTVKLTARRETAGAPAALSATCDRKVLDRDGRDAAVVQVSVLDAMGRVVPTAHNQIDFAVTGAGKLLGLGNGDPSSHEPDKATSRQAFNGLCSAIVQSATQPGELVIEVSSFGLKSARVSMAVAATPASST